MPQSAKHARLAGNVQDPTLSDVHTRIHVAADHTITGVAPPDVPPGDREITIALPPLARQPAKKPFDVNDLPEHDLGPWPEGLSLRREDMYGDDGR
ncbi:MAG TPA: hypothetical protein VIM52_15210 [Stellaceae bacterium]